MGEESLTSKSQHERDEGYQALTCALKELDAARELVNPACCLADNPEYKTWQVLGRRNWSFLRMLGRQYQSERYASWPSKLPEDADERVRIVLGAISDPLAGNLFGKGEHEFALNSELAALLQTVNIRMGEKVWAGQARLRRQIEDVLGQAQQGKLPQDPAEFYRSLGVVLDNKDDRYYILSYILEQFSMCFPTSAPPGIYHEVKAFRQALNVGQKHNVESWIALWDIVEKNPGTAAKFVNMLLEKLQRPNTNTSFDRYIGFEMTGLLPLLKSATSQRGKRSGLILVGAGDLCAQYWGLSKRLREAGIVLSRDNTFIVDKQPLDSLFEVNPDRYMLIYDTEGNVRRVRAGELSDPSIGQMKERITNEAHYINWNLETDNLLDTCKMRGADVSTVVMTGVGTSLYGLAQVIGLIPGGSLFWFGTGSGPWPSNILFMRNLNGGLTPLAFSDNQGKNALFVHDGDVSRFSSKFKIESEDFLGLPPVGLPQPQQRQ